MSAADEKDKTGWTGDRERYGELQKSFELQAAVAGISAEALVIAYAVRAGLAEIAVEISSIRGFGVGQAAKRT
jgi:hypothetical protein